jgi:hypothetical protein
VTTRRRNKLKASWSTSSGLANLSEATACETTLPVYPSLEPVRSIRFSWPMARSPHKTVVGLRGANQ